MDSDKRKEIEGEIERLQSSPASEALRWLVKEEQKHWQDILLGEPMVVTDREREYAAGAAAGIWQVYKRLGKILKWGAK